MHETTIRNISHEFEKEQGKWEGLEGGKGRGNQCYLKIKKHTETLTNASDYNDRLGRKGDCFSQTYLQAKITDA